MYFEKVRFSEFYDSIVNSTDDGGISLSDDIIKQWYEELKLPQRATYYSAGYDFFTPYTIQIYPNASVVIPTGIKWITDVNNKDKVLLCMPRSGLGIKYGLRLSNTIPVVDADYGGNNTNDGHILMKLFNPSDQIVTLPKGKAFIQGVILPYFTVSNEILPTQERNGGIGSTDPH